MQGHEACSSTTRLLNLILYANTTSNPTLLSSADAEKVFDRVNWGFLQQDAMNSWTRGKEVLSMEFTLANYTRQGCPLSLYTC